MLSRSNDTEITKRDAHQTDDDAFSRIEYIDLHVLYPQKGNEEREKEDRGKMRKNETHKPHQSLIRSSSSSKEEEEEEEEEDKNTRQQEEEDNENVTTREEDSFKPTSDGSSQRRTHGRVFLVCLVV